MPNAFRTTLTTTYHGITLEPAPMPPNEDGEIAFDCPVCGTRHVVTLIRRQ